MTTMTMTTMNNVNNNNDNNTRNCHSEQVRPSSTHCNPPDFNWTHECGDELLDEPRELLLSGVLPCK